MSNLRILGLWFENAIAMLETLEFVLLDWNFKKTIFTFEISTREFVLFQNFMKK